MTLPCAVARGRKRTCKSNYSASNIANAHVAGPRQPETAPNPRERKPDPSIRYWQNASEGGTSMVHKLVHGIVGALAFMACPFSVHAQAQGTDPGVKLAFMPRTMTVTLLNEGGKYVV